MDVLKAIKTRRSIRQFDSTKKVTEKQIKKLLEAARWAPSAGNLQSRFFVVVRDKTLKDKLMQASGGQKMVGQAQALIISCADFKRVTYYGSRGQSLYAIQDATIAAQNIWLAATAMGLGTVWVGAFNEKKVAKLLELPSTMRPIAILPIGYPAKIPSPPPRHPLSKIYKKL